MAGLKASTRNLGVAFGILGGCLAFTVLVMILLAVLRSKMAKRAIRRWRNSSPDYDLLETTLTPEELEGHCARSGFTEDEVKRLWVKFYNSGGGRSQVPVTDLIQGIEELSTCELICNLPSALWSQARNSKNVEDVRVDFSTAITALSVFTDRASPVDKTRFLFRVYDQDGDGVVSKDDIRSVLEKVMPFLEDQDDGELLDEAVASVMKEITGDEEADGISYEQYEMVVHDLAAERVLVFF